MAEEETQEQAETQAPVKQGRFKRSYVIGAGALMLVLMIGVPAAVFLLKEKPSEVKEITPELGPEASLKPEGHDDGDIALEEGEEALGAIVPFDTFLVNLSGGRYIRVQIQVEFETLDIPRRFYTRAVPIRDSIISLLTQMTADNLESMKGKDKLRTEIRSVINTALRKEEVRRVYFTQFVIQ